MGLFKHIEGETAVIVENGIYKPVDLYAKDGYLFAKLGSGYVMLYADGATSKPKARIDVLSYEGRLYKSVFGKLCISPIKDTKPLDASTAVKLLGLPVTEGQ